MNDVAIQQVAVSKGDIEPFSYRKLIAWSWRVVSHAPAIFALSVAIGVGVQLLPLALLQIVNDLVGGLQSGRDPSSFAGLAEIFFVLTILLVVGQLGGDAVAAISDSRMLRWLQQTLHERILSQGPSYHDRHDVGENSTVVLQDAAGGQVVMRTVIASPVTLSFGFVGALVLLFQNLSKVGDMPGWIQAILLVSLVLVPIFGWRLQNSVGTAAAVGRSFMGELNNEFMNSASTPLEVQLLGALPQRNAAFGQRLDAYLKAKTRTTIRLTLSKAFGVSAPDVLRAGFMLVGVLLASHMPDAVAAKAILGIYFFVPAALAPVQQIVSFAGNLRMSWPSVSRVGALLDAADDSPASATLPAADLARVLVSLDHVTFTYPGAPAPVLRELTHSFAPGVVTAIVGRAGTGKSSIIGLIDGLRRADSGTVRLAGRDVAQIESTALRNAVAVVSQFPMFITDTVRANFQLAKPDVADAEIEDICRRIGLWDTFVRLSPNAPLDHRMSRTAGKDLSGGERRLLGVARVLLRKPALLLLDEPTTGVDAMTIQRLVQFLKQDAAGKTVILVEHNLDFVTRMADQICCLQNGVFVDVGTPAELSARPSLFKDLLESRDRMLATDDMSIERFPLPAIGSMPKAGGDPALPIAKKILSQNDAANGVAMGKF